MGGKAFHSQGIDTVRMPTAVLIRTAEPVLDALRTLSSRISPDSPPPRLVPWIRNKPDHGDADIVVPSSLVAAAGDALLVETVGSALQVETLGRRPNAQDPMLALAALLPEGWFQIDLITAPDEIHDFAVRFLSHGDTGTMIGLIARQAGFLFGAEGMRLPVRIPNAPRNALMLTTDFSSALEEIGFDPEPHAVGFDDEEAVATWIASSRYFDPAVFLPNRITSDGRQRSKRRPTRNRFVAAITAHPGRFVWPEPWDHDLQRRLTDAALRRFGRFDAHAEMVAHIQAAIDAERTSFGGEAVSRISGVTGRALPHLVNAIRKSFPSPEEFVAWKQSADEDAISKRLDAVLPTFLPHTGPDA